MKSRLTYPDASYVDEYDGLDRLARVKHNGDLIATYSYDELSRRTAITYANSSGNYTSIIYEYDIANPTSAVRGENR